MFMEAHKAGVDITTERQDWQTRENERGGMAQMSLRIMVLAMLDVKLPQFGSDPR